jgi:hypothetical protein
MTTRILVLMAAAAGLAAGCGTLWVPVPDKPQLYRIEGRVLDATNQTPVANARVMLRAAIPQQLITQGLPVIDNVKPGGGGAIQMTGYGFTRSDGTYDVELSEGFEIVKTAKIIRVEVSAAGYLSGSVDIPPPTQPAKVYKVPNVFLPAAPRSATGRPLPLGTRPSPTPTEKAIPWQ